MRRPTLDSKFYAGFVLALLGIWLVDGIVIAPNAYAWFHFFVPGLRSFVEPDYFSPLYIWGAFVMLAAAVRLGARAYGVWWRGIVWLVALSGVVPFLPIGFAPDVAAFAVPGLCAQPGSREHAVDAARSRRTVPVVAVRHQRVHVVELTVGCDRSDDG